MARRPRPGHGVVTPHNKHVRQSKAQVAKQNRPKAVDFFSEPEDGSDPEPVHSTMARPPQAHVVLNTDMDSDGDSGEDISDVPRAAQWIDDEELKLHDQTDLDDASASPGSDSENADADADDDRVREAEPSSRRLRSLQDDLSTLPLGTLRSAQRALTHAHALSDTESDSEAQSDDDSDDAEDTSSHPTKGKEPEQPSKTKTDIAKRTNKHAPVEITSKRPVSRRRTVVDDKLPKSRDPRFMHATGRYDPTKFKQRYDFLAELRKVELSTLREHTKRARKLTTNSPSHLREERDEEVKRLERAMKRAESAVNLDNRERVELEAVRFAKRTEEDKRKQGKAEWWMKRSAKKELLVKARLDAIASIGGKQAVKKALEKKQKKIGQKEKKMRPAARSEGVELSNGKRRRPVGSVDLGGTKRRKVV